MSKVSAPLLALPLFQWQGGKNGAAATELFRPMFLAVHVYSHHSPYVLNMSKQNPRIRWAPLRLTGLAKVDAVAEYVPWILEPVLSVWHPCLTRGAVLGGG